MATFVLVHGAMGGGWGWRRLRPLLQAAGHDVFTPTLTGLGERAHLLTPEVGLETHIQDVVNCIWYEDLRDVALVGHSYAGMVVTGVADRLPERIRHLVYIDAFVPRDGQSVIDIAGSGPPGDDWLVQPPPAPRDQSPERARGWDKLTPHPRKTLEDRIKLSRPIESYGFSLTYIKPTAVPRQAGDHDAFYEAADYAREQPRWRYLEIDSGHSPHVTASELLAEMLLGLL